MSLLQRFFASPPPPPDFIDSVLGVLRWSDDAGAWVCRAVRFSGEVSFHVGGDREPDPLLIAHARDLAGAPEQLERLIAAALEEAALAFHPKLASEIRALQLEWICLCWPERPNDGLLYMTDGHEGRVWHFAYIERRPECLGFDS